jgi:hypothetical protein
MYPCAWLPIRFAVPSRLSVAQAWHGPHMRTIGRPKIAKRKKNPDGRLKIVGVLSLALSVKRRRKLPMSRGATMQANRGFGRNADISTYQGTNTCGGHLPTEGNECGRVRELR